MKVFLMIGFTGPRLDNFAGVRDTWAHFFAAGSGDTIASSSKVKDTDGRNCGRRCSNATLSTVSGAGLGLWDVMSGVAVLLCKSLSHSLLLLPSIVSAEAMPSSLTGLFQTVNSEHDAPHSSVVAPMSLGTDWVLRLEVRIGVVGGRGV